MQRRHFLTLTGATLASAAAGRALATTTPAPRPPSRPAAPVSWDNLRDQFELDPNVINFGGFFLAQVPRPVRNAVARHRAEFDKDPMGYWESSHSGAENAVRAAAGEYFGVNGPREIALTDSTTMGLGLLYSGIIMRPGQHVLSTVHDHWATNAALDMRAAKTGNKVNRITLYENPAAASAGDIVARIRAAITPETRILALTWLHSVSGVKLPLARIAEVVADANVGRGMDERLLFCVDGVHGTGIDDVTIPQLGVDFLSAGTHKWLLGPRGTGILWGREALWEQVIPSICSFSGKDTPAQRFTPGGFHTFENRWAADEAFKFHLALGKPRVAQHLRAMNERVRDELARIPSLALHTPRDWELSAGITCFLVEGQTPTQVVEKLKQRGITASVSPYTPQTARVACCMWNTDDEVSVLVKEMKRVCA